jgi:hypothetical protein
MRPRMLNLVILFSMVVALVAAKLQAADATLRPPAVPLVAVDPYFSVWSFADHLTYDSTRHWSGTPMPLRSLVRVDGETYRIMGREPGNLTPARQLGLQVLPTRTLYVFQAGGARIQLTFLTPALPRDLEALSRPVTYLVWSVQSTDGRPHDVSVYYDNTGELAVNTPDEPVAYSSQSQGGLDVLKVGTTAQPVLGKTGDFIRADWGYVYAAAPQSEAPQDGVAAARPQVQSFIKRGQLLAASEQKTGAPHSAAGAVMAFVFKLGSVGAQPVSRHLILAYDEVYPIEYFHRRLRSWWQHDGTSTEAMLANAEAAYPQLAARASKFDTELMADLADAGGKEYAQVAAAAYRQVFAANKLALGTDGQPLLFLKEISSCGCAQTVDVIYPESPMLLLLNPKLLEYSLIPILDYAQSGSWPYPYSPHDLGVYPVNNARVPSQMESMPVEESGNMLLMIAAIAQAEGKASFAAKYWPLLTKWAEYLRTYGLDPGDQLCTDDFTGLLAHNANLALKAVEALGAYASLARMQGKNDVADAYQATAHQYAQAWMQKAGDGDHTRLAYDRPGTWSQKYNLVWDQVLGLNLFSKRVAATELAYYRAHQTDYGFPLDSRSAYTKLDWEAWSATLAPSSREFQALFSGLYHFADATPTRVPLSDWYWTIDGTQVGFQARPVVGGIYMKTLAAPALWQKWARAAQ